MRHNRTKMELIEKENTRMQIYQKRKKSLLKKVKEFSVLCGVEACIIIYEPKLKNLGNQKLDATWPPNPGDVKRIVNTYKTSNQPNRCYNIADYFTEKKKHLDTETSKLRRKIYEAKYPSSNTNLDTFSEDHLRLFVDQLDMKLEFVYQKLNAFQQNQYMFNPHIINNLQPLELGFPFQFQPAGQSSAMIPIPPRRNIISNNDLQLFSNFHEAVMTQNLLEKKKNNSDRNWANIELQLFSDAKPQQAIQNPRNQFGGPSLSSFVNPSCYPPSMRNVGSTSMLPPVPENMISLSFLHNNQNFPNSDQENKFYCNINLGFKKD